LNDAVVLTPIGVFCGPYRGRNGTPRQALLANTRGVVQLFQDVLAGGSGDALQGLEGYSHVWLITHLHDTSPHKASAKVAPPRLGGEQVGVLATRAPHRPNPLGLSVVKLDKVEVRACTTAKAEGSDSSRRPAASTSQVPTCWTGLLSWTSSRMSLTQTRWQRPFRRGCSRRRTPGR
jgi:tRNA-Thr(GGU) m(6)t(6)A37 methyltransferase TsaA